MYLRSKEALLKRLSFLLPALLMVGCGGGGGGGTSAVAPSATTAGASFISASTATLNGSVNPNGTESSAWFEWSTSSNLQNATVTAKKSVGAGTALQSVSETITGVTRGATYYYRVVARNAGGITQGSIVSCTTVQPTFRTYTTSFPLTETVISEGGNWTNGRAIGIDWHNVSITGGNAIGEYSDVDYSDPTAVLTGTWRPDQMAEATAYCANSSLVYGQDIEIRLRSSVTSHSNTGYEVFWGCRTGSTAYAYVVRWNGALGDYTVLQQRSGSAYGVVTGDKIKAIVVGNQIKGYINGVEVLDVVDNTPITSGNPGIGFNANVGATNVDFGFQDFTATDDPATF